MQELTAIIEMPRGTRLKMEMVKAQFVPGLRVDRLLKLPIPFSYGYIPNTLAGDGDPLDVFVICDDAIPPMTFVPLQLHGVITCIDNGAPDDKLIATIAGDERDIAEDVRAIVAWLSRYKPGFVVGEVFGPTEAQQIVEQCRSSQ